MVEDPLQLGGRKIGIDQQPGARGDPVAMPGLAQFGAEIGGAPVLPDDGIMDRRARGPVPDKRGFALVGDADGGDVPRAEAGLLDRRAGLAREQRPVGRDQPELADR